MNPLSQAVASGLMSGAVYALLAAGLVLAFHTSRVVNLAHGEAYAVAGLVASALSGYGWPRYAALPAALLAAVLFLTSLEHFLLRPRRDWPVGSLILITLATAFLMRGLLQVVIGVDPLSFPRLFVGPPVRILGGIIPLQGIFLIVIGLGTAAGVLLLLRSPMGWRLRATAENPEMAALLGINTARMRLLAFGIAGALGGLGALLLVPLVSVDYQSGLGMTLRGFIAAAIGGMSPSWAIVSGVGLGLAEALVTTYMGALAQDPIVFLALIGVAVWQSRTIMFGGSVRA